MEFRKLSLLKFLELAIAVACIVLHYKTRTNDFDTDTLSSTAYGGYIIILIGSIGEGVGDYDNGKRLFVIAFQFGLSKDFVAHHEIYSQKDKHDGWSGRAGKPHRKLAWGGVILLIRLGFSVLMEMPIPRKIYIFYCLVGCGTFVASGALNIEIMKHWGKSELRDYGLAKSILAIINGALFITDALLEWKEY